MAEIGYFLNGEYIRGKVPLSVKAPGKQPLHDAYQLDRAREDFRRDFLQPRINGKPNPEFVKAYPQESREIYFTEEELKGMERP